MAAEQPSRIELDTDTNNLLVLWKVINHDQKPITNLGQIDANIIAAAIEKGIRAGQIEIAWRNDKQPNPPQVTMDETAQKVVVAIDKKVSPLSKKVSTVSCLAASPHTSKIQANITSPFSRKPHQKNELSFPV